MYFCCRYNTIVYIIIAILQPMLFRLKLTQILLCILKKVYKLYWSGVEVSSGNFCSLIPSIIQALSFVEAKRNISCVEIKPQITLRLDDINEKQWRLFLTRQYAHTMYVVFRTRAFIKSCQIPYITIGTLWSSIIPCIMAAYL